VTRSAPFAPALQGFRVAIAARRTGRRRLAVLLAASLAAASPATARACLYEAGPAGGLSVAHASSIPVAMAIGGAVAAGRLQPLADVPAQIALTRASLALRAFAGMLDPTAEGLPPIAVVLVEAHLWGRTTSGPDGPRFVAHAEGPAVGDVILVTGESALRALLAGHITWDAAEAAGIIVVDGPPQVRDRVARLFAQRFS
jgi:hypothetical protein